MLGLAFNQSDDIQSKLVSANCANIPVLYGSDETISKHLGGSFVYMSKISFVLEGILLPFL